MTTIADCARAFVASKPAKCHNAKSTGSSYILHNTTISWHEGGAILGTYGGWLTASTHNHLKAIARACNGTSPPPYGKHANTDSEAIFTIKSV